MYILIKGKVEYFHCLSLELDALGDEFLTEDDSYLDNLEAPNPPSGLPVDSTVKSKVREKCQRVGQGRQG